MSPLDASPRYRFPPGKSLAYVERRQFPDRRDVNLLVFMGVARASSHFEALYTQGNSIVRIPDVIASDLSA
jgi:hypothetical protein